MSDDNVFAPNPFRLLTETWVVLSLQNLNIQDFIHLNWNPRMTSQHVFEISEIRPSNNSQLLLAMQTEGRIKHAYNRHSTNESMVFTAITQFYKLSL